jgi:hypothetical protein
MVLNLAEPVLVGDVVGPPLDGGAFDLNGAAAVAADQVMVMAHRAAPVGGFAVVGADQVKLASVSHHQQGPVDRCQPDALTLVAEVVVDLVGGAEVVGAGEQVGDGGALPGLPLRGGYHAALLRRSEVTAQQYDKDFQ